MLVAHTPYLRLTSMSTMYASPSKPMYLVPWPCVRSSRASLFPRGGSFCRSRQCSSVMHCLFASGYAFTKGALSSYSRVLRMELKPFNTKKKLTKYAEVSVVSYVPNAIVAKQAFQAHNKRGRASPAPSKQPSQVSSLAR